MIEKVCCRRKINLCKLNYEIKSKKNNRILTIINIILKQNLLIIKKLKFNIRLLLKNIDNKDLYNKNLELNFLFFKVINYDWKYYFKILLCLNKSICRLYIFDESKDFKRKIHKISINNKQSFFEFKKEYHLEKNYLNINLNEYSIELKLINEIFEISGYVYKIVRFKTKYHVSIKYNIRDFINLIQKKIKIHSANFSDFTSLESRILNFYLRLAGTDTLLYQHGGVHGAQENMALDEMACVNATYFLNYGPMITSEKYYSVNKDASKFLPVGSMRLHTFHARKQKYHGYILDKNVNKNKKRRINILWISEGSSINTSSLWHQSEDVTRFRIQQKCITLLANKFETIQLIYRPIPDQVNLLATPYWIRDNYKNVSVDLYSDFFQLILESDIVITDTHSNTSWDETLVASKPLITYLNPSITQLNNEYAKLINKTFKWCKTEREFLNEIAILCADPEKYINDYSFETSDYFDNFLINSNIFENLSKKLGIIN